MKLGAMIGVLALGSMVIAGVAPVPAAMARTYDCTKPANASKKQCKAATAATTPAPSVAATSTSKTKHYDCTKPANANKNSCKVAVTAAAPAVPSASKPSLLSRFSKPAAPAAALAPATHATAGVSPAGPAPAGATAKCRDGTWSHSQHHSGTCSHHGGVAQFL